MGSANGFMIVVGNLGGISAPLATGFVVQSTGSFAAAFTVVGVIMFIGSACVFLLSRLQKPGI
jgi:ACS family glucarate transporter-like MFS transporter